MRLVYVVRPHEHNESLRHSLRSVAKHLPHGEVTLVGYKPSWVRRVEHVDIKQATNSHTNVVPLLREFVGVCEDQEWVLMNDDFFAMAPNPEIPLVHTGSLASLSTKPEWRMGVYRDKIANTRNMLAKWGIERPLSYDRVHRPLPVRNEVMVEALSRVRSPAVLHRSLYGNLAGGSVLGQDVKIRGYRDDLNQDAWTSTSVTAWRGKAGARIRARFNEPCEFEA